MFRCLSRFGSHRQLHTRASLNARLPGADDLKDPWKILKNDLVDGRIENYLPCPRQTDIAIIGGSVIGSSVAYFIKNQMNKTEVTVIEPDQTYANSSALLSVGGMRQQFSCTENILMSQYGYEFLRHADYLLAVQDKSPPDVQFNHTGYLILANKDQADSLMVNHRLQEECGAKNIILSNAQLKAMYPWMDCEGVELASLGQQGEGWLDPAALLAGLKGKAKSLGVNYVSGKVIGFEYKEVKLNQQNQRKVIDQVLVELPNGDVQPMRASIFVNAAGPSAGKIATLAGIGNKDIHMDCSIPLPVEPRKRYVFSYHCANGPDLQCPLVTDQPQGNVYFRREGLGGIYIAGKSPETAEEPLVDNLDVDYTYFDDEIWPRIAKRVPAFENIKLKGAWAGFYDHNYVDQNLIIGPHPHFNNFLFTNGSSGHGLQHSLAIGKSIMELIVYNEYRTIDLKKFGFDRFMNVDADVSSAAESNIY